MMGFLAAIAVAVPMLTSTPQPPQWESDYGRALDITKSTGQPLLIILDQPTVPEMRIEPVRLSQDKIAGEEAALLAPYQLCHVDVTTAYGKKVAAAFGVTSFPHVAIIDKTGKKIIYRQTGKMTSDQWRTTLVSHQTGNVRVVAYKPVTSDPVHMASPLSSPTFDPSYCPSCQNGY